MFLIEKKDDFISIQEFDYIDNLSKHVSKHPKAYERCLIISSYGTILHKTNSSPSIREATEEESCGIELLFVIDESLLFSPIDCMTVDL